MHFESYQHHRMGESRECSASLHHWPSLLHLWSPQSSFLLPSRDRRRRERCLRCWEDVLDIKPPPSCCFPSPSYQSRRYRGPEVSLSHWWNGWHHPCRSQSLWAGQGRRSPPASVWSVGVHPSALLGLQANIKVHWTEASILLQLITLLYLPTNIALWGIILSSHHRSVALHQTHYSVEMTPVDDSAVVWGAFRISAIKFLGWIKRSGLNCTVSFTLQCQLIQVLKGCTSRVCRMHSTTRPWMQGSHRM